MLTVAHRSSAVAASESKVTNARLVARLTDALSTDSWPARARSMRVAQALQCMPCSASSTVATGAVSGAGGAPGSDAVSITVVRHLPTGEWRGSRGRRRGAQVVDREVALSNVTEARAASSSTLAPWTPGSSRRVSSISAAHDWQCMPLTSNSTSVDGPVSTDSGVAPASTPSLAIRPA